MLLASGGRSGTVQDERKSPSTQFIPVAFLLVSEASLSLDVEGSPVLLPLVPLADSSSAPGPLSALEILCPFKHLCPAVQGPVSVLTGRWVHVCSASRILLGEECQGEPCRHSWERQQFPGRIRILFKPCDLGSHPWGGSHVEPIVQSPRGVGFTETSGGDQQFLTWAQGTGLCLAPLPLSGLLLAPPLLSALSS